MYHTEAIIKKIGFAKKFKERRGGTQEEYTCFSRLTIS